MGGFFTEMQGVWPLGASCPPAGRLSGLGLTAGPSLAENGSYSSAKYRQMSSGRANASGACRMERSEEHTSELQSLMRSSYAVFCLKKNTKQTTHNTNEQVRQLKDQNSKLNNI